MLTEKITKNDILKLLQQNQSRIKAFGVKKIGLFGSFVRGNQKNNSDIDLLVEFDKAQKTFDNFISLSFYLEDILHHKVDIVTSDSLSPYIGPHILREIEYASISS